MSVSDAQLNAYVDGELPDAHRILIEQAILEDPGIAQRIARHRALRDRLRQNFDAVLQEPVPDRLVQLVGSAQPASATIADLSTARAARMRPAISVLASRSGWFALAASLLVGVVAGVLAAQWTSRASLTAFSDGTLIAQGALASALNEQLASAIPAGAVVHVGLSFKAKSGRYCRAFDISGSGGTAGLACRERQRWQVLTLMGIPATADAESAYRMAGSAVPPLLLQMIDANISGEPLDADAERRARSAGWQ